jgi:methylase of polypeptide subunit release factors
MCMIRAMHTETITASSAETLGELMRELGYSEDGIHELLGEDAYDTEPEDVPALARRLERGRLATAIELLFLLRPVTEDDAVRAFGRRGVEALVDAGLAEVAGEVAPRARVLPVGDLLVAGDGFSKGLDDPPDYVAPFSPTSRVLAALTPRRRVGSALDVGTGSGAQALLAAQHAQRVVATDVNERALEFTRLNARLNGLANVECRLGSLFDPVGDEQFDLITCNAPYVISPERRWMYRDAGFAGDELSARIVEGATALLAEGGFATMNVSWLAANEDEPDERVLSWIDTSTCDAWVLVAWEADPLHHAAEWTADQEHVSAVDSALDEWMHYFESLGARWVTEGTVVLHRRGGAGRGVRIDSIDPDDLDDAADQVERAFLTRERLASLRRPDALLELPLAIAAPLRFEHELDPRRGRREAFVSLTEGTNSEVETTPAALDVLGALDGGLSLGAVVDDHVLALGLDDADAKRLRRDALKLARELLELGALTVAN